MSKYIIKNCPAIFYSGIIDEAKCWQKREEFDESCQNCTDCLLKQIVEKCKNAINKKYEEEDVHLFSKADLKIINRIHTDVGIGCRVTAEVILKLLDIEEI